MNIPQLTILIPAYNEENTIIQCLESIVNQTIKADKYRVIIIANSCNDDTEQKVKEFIKSNKSKNIDLITTESRGKAKALNLGIQRTETENVAYMDADCTIEATVFEKVLERFKKEDLLVIGALDIPLFSNKASLLFEYQTANQIYREVRGRVIPIGRFCAFRKSKLIKFPENIHSEDTWLALEIASKYGWKSIKVFNDIKVFFMAPNNWIDFIKQESRFEQGFEQLINIFPDLEKAWKVRRDNFTQQKTEIQIFEEISKRLKERKFPISRFKKLNSLLGDIIDDNSKLMQGQLINSYGHFDPITSTKIQKPS